VSESSKRRLLLIGWDAADWWLINPLLERGEMPHLAGLLERGVMGNIASLSPMLSPILWTSIATGKYGDKHGILSFVEPDPETGKVRPATTGSRTARAIWNILSDAGKKVGVVSWLATHPAEKLNGFMVSDQYPLFTGDPDKPRPATPHSVYPESYHQELSDLRVHPSLTTPEQIAPFVPTVRDLDPKRDEPLRMVRTLLAGCATVHVAATHMMQQEDWDFCGLYYDSIDRFGHAFMEYFPPRQPQISEADFTHYQGVMNGCYRFHDMMLGRLLEIAGEDTTVMIVSDHGFYSDHLRPTGTSRIKDGQPVTWHRPYGVFVLAGPGIKKDERVYGASLLDVAPTILMLFGLPQAKDMDGQPLTQVLETPTNIEDLPTVDTYETGKPFETVAPEDAAEDPWAAQAALEQLINLGYLEPNPDLAKIKHERLRNLAQIHSAKGEQELAIKYFREVLEESPNDPAARLGLAACLLNIGELDESEACAKDILAKEANAPRAQFFLGMIAFRRGESELAMQHLRAAQEADGNLPGLDAQIGRVYLMREQFEEALGAFEKAIEVDPNHAEAYDGLGLAYRQLKRPAEAVHAFMQSVALLHYRPQTHIHLGLALAESGQIDWAIRAFNVALEMSPHAPAPHRFLSELYERAKKDPEKAKFHRQEAMRLLALAQQDDAGAKE
jgi:predicted AlkP superfamily phosphohydrolase/phosphomutase/tetratricopeptide (TPR) repeat protein